MRRLWIVALLWIAGCGANAPPGAPFFTGPGVSAVTYGGVLPCLDCAAQQVVLTMFPDGVYRLRRTYESAPGGEVEDFYELGKWYLAEEEGNRLELTGGSFGSFPDTTQAERRMPEAAIAQLRVHEGATALLLHETEDAKRSAVNHELVRLDEVDFIPGPMFLRGMYVYEPNAGTFLECLTEKEYPLAPGGELEALEVAYLASKLPKEQPVLARIEGRFVLREPQPGALPREHLAVERFDRLLPTELCFPDTVVIALLGTEWSLVEIDGSAVSIAAEGTQPALTFSAEGNRVSGTGGCNRIFGQFELPANEGMNGLRIPGVQSTRMACAPAVMELESAFVSAIESIAFYAIVNDVLELRDAQHHLRLRFQARREGP